MKQPLISATILSTIFLATACGQTNTNSALQDTTHQRNADVQITGAAGHSMVCFLDKDSHDPCSGLDVIKPETQCEEIAKSESSSYIYKTFDCTLAIGGKYGRPVMNKIEVQGTKSKTGSDQRMFFNELAHIKTVYAVIKESALNAESFEGIGFYVGGLYYKPWNSRPASGGEDMGWYTVKGGLTKTGVVTLKNGEKARQLEFSLALKGSLGGTNYINGAYFRPYAKFAQDGQAFQNWDQVASDYFVDINSSFDRSNDVLQ